MVYRRTPRADAVRSASREALVKAARKLMSKRGPEVTMQEIVEHAGTSIGNAYFYFRNKDELLAEVLHRVVDERWAIAEELATDLPPGARRIAVISVSNITGMLSDERLFATFMTTSPQRLAYLASESLSRWTREVSAAFPERDAVEYERCASAIYGCNRTLAEQWLERLSGSPTDVAEFAARWNLSALGVPPNEVDDAVQFAIRRVTKT